MSTASTLHPRPGATTRPHRHRRLAAFSGAVAASAWGGVVGLVGGGIQMPDRIVERLPFDSLPFGGVALGLVVAVPTTTAAVLAWRGSTWTSLATQTAGVMTMGWIVVQMGFMRELSFFHPLYLGVGAALVVAGRRVGRSVRDDAPGTAPATA